MSNAADAIDQNFTSVAENAELVKYQAGTGSLSSLLAGGDTTHVEITFAKNFTKTPAVTVSQLSEYPGTATFSVRNVSTTGFDLYVKNMVSSGESNYWYYWIAVIVD